jgi:mono/diheme cytochrome c family protein
LRLPTIFLSMAAVLCLLAPVANAEDKGSALFQSNCLMCHGADGKGTPTGQAMKVVDFHDPEAIKMSDADLAAIIGKGKNNMPAFGTRLTSPEIENLVAYIRILQK